MSDDDVENLDPEPSTREWRVSHRAGDYRGGFKLILQGEAPDARAAEESVTELITEWHQLLDLPGYVVAAQVLTSRGQGPQ